MAVSMLANSSSDGSTFLSAAAHGRPIMAELLSFDSPREWMLTTVNSSCDGFSCSSCHGLLHGL